MAPPSKRGRRTKAQGTLGPTVQVTYRLPRKLHEKLDKIAESLFQPLPVILRAAAAEYVKAHRPARWTNTGIEFNFPGDINQPIEATLAELGKDIEGNALAEYGIDRALNQRLYAEGKPLPEGWLLNEAGDLVMINNKVRREHGILDDTEVSPSEDGTSGETNSRMSPTP